MASRGGLLLRLLTCSEDEGFDRVSRSDTVEPLYKHTTGNRICMLIMEVCLCRGTVLAHLKNSGPESQCL